METGCSASRVCGVHLKREVPTDQQDGVRRELDHPPRQQRRGRLGRAKDVVEGPHWCASRGRGSRRRADQLGWIVAAFTFYRAV